MHYILSDIHGNKEAFDTLLSLIDLQQEDHLYILGDVIDRGTHGIELLQQIREMKNCTLLLGNHEYMMVNAFRHPDNLHLKYLWRNNGYMHTYDRFVDLTQEEQEDLLRYLESLPVQLEITVNRRRFILVHAAPQELLVTENERCYDPKEFMVWHRLSQYSRMPARKNVIFGHTPTWKYHKKPLIFHGKKMLAIDCGCGFPNRGGQLGCIRLEDMTEYYSEDGIFTQDEAVEWLLKR
ncbi:metallophosphoesterase [Ruminococcus flavefaciens]|uniref:metallophosphoesterase n=1 Tax=Ruminococcus flavefaciens TaxID=1265 RepID=UPI0026EA8C3E|nr:metallophosphoesterase [Ruminococcus flavefaciens]